MRPGGGVKVGGVLQVNSELEAPSPSMSSALFVDHSFPVRLVACPSAPRGLCSAIERSPISSFASPSFFVRAARHWMRDSCCRWAILAGTEYTAAVVARHFAGLQCLEARSPGGRVAVELSIDRRHEQCREVVRPAAGGGRLSIGGEKDPNPPCCDRVEPISTSVSPPSRSVPTPKAVSRRLNSCLPCRDILTDAAVCKKSARKRAKHADALVLCPGHARIVIAPLEAEHNSYPALHNGELHRRMHAAAPLSSAGTGGKRLNRPKRPASVQELAKRGRAVERYASKLIGRHREVPRGGGDGRAWARFSIQWTRPAVGTCIPLCVSSGFVLGPQWPDEQQASLLAAPIRGSRNERKENPAWDELGH